MGISGLLPLVKEAINHSAHIRNYSGKRVAVDGYAWLHKAVFTCAVELAKGQPTDKWIGHMMSLLKVLLDHQIHTTLVFDGADLPAKQGTEDSRALKRQTALSRAQMLEKEGKSAEAYTSYSQAVDVSPFMAAHFIRVLRASHPQVQVLVAPFEADAQLSYLIRQGHVDAIISEDSDCIPYGCENIIFKLSRDGSCSSLCLSDLQSTFIKGFDLRKFDKDMLQILCTAAGCDYLNSVKNFGIKKAHGMVTRHKTATRLLRAMRISGLLPLKLASLPAPAAEVGTSHSTSSGAVAGEAPVVGASGMIGKVSSEVDRSSLSHPSRRTNTTASDPGPRVSPSLLQYEFDFFRALCTFKYQVVFDPISRCTVHLEPLNFAALPLCLQHLVLPSEREDSIVVSARLSHFGTILEPEVAAGIADGLLDPVSKQPFDFSGVGGGAAGLTMAKTSASASASGNTSRSWQRTRGAKADSRPPPQKTTMHTYFSATSKAPSTGTAQEQAGSKAVGPHSSGTGSSKSGLGALAGLGPPLKKGHSTKKAGSNANSGSGSPPSSRKRKSEGAASQSAAAYLVSTRKIQAQSDQSNKSNKVPKASSSRFFGGTNSKAGEGPGALATLEIWGDLEVNPKSTSVALREIKDLREREAMERLEGGHVSPSTDFNLDRFRNPAASSPLRVPLPAAPAATRVTSDNTASTPSSLFNYSEDISPQSAHSARRSSPRKPVEKRSSKIQSETESKKRGFFDDFRFTGT